MFFKLLFQLRIAWLTPKRLPQSIRDLFIGRQRLTSIECGVLEAFVIEELHKLKVHTETNAVVVQLGHISGVPPPLDDRLSMTVESNLVA